MTVIRGPCKGGSPMKTLPDYLAPGLDIVFVGINPGVYSAQVGHYFASPRNRFWPAINRSGLLMEPLGPSTDDQALLQGIGFTDVVKRPSNGAFSIDSLVEWYRRLNRLRDGLKRL